jgi:hypothetical protein
MRLVAKKLNLKGHTSGRAQRFLYFPGDIEGHKGPDMRYYLVDFARLMPPEAPSLQPKERELDRRGVFYKFLRPELVRSNPVPLSCDAFSQWGEHGDVLEVIKCKREVRDATNRLYNHVIPEFAKQLEIIKEDLKLSTSSEKMIEELKWLQSSNEVVDLKEEGLVEGIHRVGMNVSHFCLFNITTLR